MTMEQLIEKYKIVKNIIEVEDSNTDTKFFVLSLNIKPYKLEFKSLEEIDKYCKKYYAMMFAY